MPPVEGSVEELAVRYGHAPAGQGHLMNAANRPRQPLGDPPYKIVFASPCWYVGGLETVTITNINSLDRDVWDPIILVGDYDDMKDSAPEGVAFIADPSLYEWKFPAKSAVISECFSRAKALFNTMQPTVVVGQLAHALMYGAAAAGVPRLVEYWHCGWGWDAIYHPSDLAIAVSRHTKQRVLNKRAVGVPMPIIYNGVDTSKFYPDEAARDTKRKELCISDRPVFGFVGRVCIEKDPVGWMEAFISVRSRVPNAAALVVGGTYSKDLEAQMDAKAQRAGLTPGVDYIRACASYTEMPDYYRAMDVLMHTRRDEPFGMVLVESLLCGTPVAGYAGGGMPEIEESILSGMDLVTVGDAPALVATAIKLSGGRLPPFSVQTVSDAFSAEVMALRFRNRLNRLLKGKQ